MTILERLKRMKSIISLSFITTFILLLSSCGGGSSGVATNTQISQIDTTTPVSDWVMVWSDEFDGTSINTNNWTFEIDCAGGGNNEKQCYTDSSDNAFVSGGILNIVALPAEPGAEKPYTSARLNTRYKRDMKYGRIEMRAKLPSGQGTWPAFWMRPTDLEYGIWPRSGEIDIVEAVNLKTNDNGAPEATVSGTLWYGSEWPNQSSSGKPYELPGGANPADDFHTYAIEWQEGEIRWYIDGYLYQTQRKSEVRYNSKDEAVGLKHRGWYAEYFDPVTGELKAFYDYAPFDKDFYITVNLAVGGNWPENVNELGIDPTAFENGGAKFEIDYIRAYECSLDTETGKGCETVRGGYDSLDDALVEGSAPIPSPPAAPVVENLTIFAGTPNPNWAAWDCCGGSTPSIVNDAMMGDVYEFSVGGNPTVNGFISRAEFLTDPAGVASPFDASGLLDLGGTVSFDMKIVSAPNDASSTWMFKIESEGASTAAELPLSDSGTEPVVGEWQNYSFSLADLAAAGLDISAIDVIMVFPAWGTGDGAVYQMTNVEISAPGIGAAPSLTIFEEGENASWPMWDCCGGLIPTVETDDAEHGAVAEFTIGGSPTVVGFISRAEFITDPAAAPAPFDASAILSNGVIQFEMKVVSAPLDANSTWLFKVESDNASSAVELPLTASVEGTAPIVGEWQTYTFNLADLANAGLDVSAIDVIMVFPAWGTGDGAVFRIDNAKIYDPTDSGGFNGFVLFADEPLDQWSIWDCCGGSTPTLENDDTEHGMTAEYVIGGAPTVMGLLADDDVYLDASALLTNGVVQFEMKVINAPNDANSVWKFKIESGDAATAVELDLTASQEGAAPVVGQWQTYTYSLQDLYDAGLDISAIDVIMVFPAWGTGDGAVYRLDNVMIYDPASLPEPQRLTIFKDEENPSWPMWDCCAGSTPTVEQDNAEHGAVAEFTIGGNPTVMGFISRAEFLADGVSPTPYDASEQLTNGVVRFDMRVVTAPNDSNSVWKFKIEAGNATSAVELDLTASQEGAAPVTGEWQTYTYSLQDLFDAGLDISEIDVVMVFPAWGTGDGAVYRIDNVIIGAP